MTIQQLQYVVSLDEHRHFVKAAKACHVTQPTLTMQLRKLEREIGFRVFDRSRQPLVPTPAGEQVIERARHILREVDSLKYLVDAEQNDLSGEYRIGIIPTVAPYLIPSFIKKLKSEHSEIKLQIREMLTEDICEAISKNQLDVGILATPINNKHLRTEPLYEEPFLLYAPPRHSYHLLRFLYPQHLESEGLLLLNEGHCLREQTLALCSKVKTGDHQINYESGSIESLKNIVQTDGGYTLVPQLAITKSDEKYTKRFEQPQPTREIALVYHHAFSKHSLIEAFKEMIKDIVPEDIAKLKNTHRVEWT